MKYAFPEILPISLRNARTTNDLRRRFRTRIVEKLLLAKKRAARTACDDGSYDAREDVCVHILPGRRAKTLVSLGKHGSFREKSRQNVNSPLLRRAIIFFTQKS